MLRASLWGHYDKNDSQLPRLTDLQVSELWQLAMEQTVEGHIAEAFQELYAGQLTEEQQDKILGIAARMYEEHQRLNAAIRRTFSFLKAQGFTPILLKGQGNARRYRSPLLRQCGDVDVYIGQQDFKRACACIRELVGDEAMQQATTSRKHLHVKSQHTTIELHRIAEYMTNPIVDARYQRLTRYWFQPGMTDTVSIDGYEVEVPARQFNVVYVFNHLWHHFVFSGIGLRQLSDWCMILHEAAGKVDLAQLEADLKQLHLLRGWQLMGMIAVKKLGLPEAEMPFYTERYQPVADQIWQRILLRGNFGKFGSHRDKRSEPYLLRKLRSFGEMHQYVTRLWSISPEDAVCMYAYRVCNGINRIINDIIKNFTK